MGKKRKGDTLGIEGTRKKHKKNKRKRCTVENLEIPSPDGEEGVLSHRPIKLKIKLGDKLISSSDATISDPLDDASSPGGSELMGGASGSSAGGGANASSIDVAEGSSLGIPDEDLIGSDISIGRDDYAGSEVEVGEEEEEVAEEEGEDPEEEAWLDALEAGEVNERGYLPQKESGTLTARQKAMLGGDEEGSPGSLLELPTGRSSEDLSEETLLKKTEKNRKRRLAAQKRKEKRKAETVRKLLEKQCTKKKDDKGRGSRKGDAPFITYISKLDSRGGVDCTLSLPHGMELPLLPVRSTTPPPVTLCAVDGCTNPKKYADSLTLLPVCSLQCYRIVHSRTETKVQRSPAAVAS